MAKFDLTQFIDTAHRIRERALTEGRLVENPTDEELRRFVEKEPGAKRNKYGGYVAESDPVSRAAMFTRNSVDYPFGDEEVQLLHKCEEILSKQKLIAIDRIVGNRQSNTVVRLIVPERFAHVAYGGKNLFIPVRGKKVEPIYYIVFFADDAFEANKTKSLPEKDITIRLAFLDDGRFVKIVRNSSYIGEYKKGVFAAKDWEAKSKLGGLFLHAGCRQDYLQSAHGDYRNITTLLVALSANGKTTTTSRIMARKGMEKSWLIQDDGGTLMPDGSFRGFEAGGMFVKTEGVNPGEQTEIFYGLLRPTTVCENVFVTEDGDFDFYNFQKTSNGRAVVLRRDFMHASPFIDADRVDNLILITRGTLIPAISKLTREQAIALMVLGQSMESSAGDPTQAGKIRSVFFYDPFVAGDLAEHANILYNIVKQLPHLNYYLLNTGGIGEGEHYRDIKLEYTIGILDSLLRGGLEDWVDSPTGFLVPKAIRVVDDIYVHPEKLFPEDEFREKQARLNQLRYDAVQKIDGNLHPGVRNVFSKLD